LVAESPVLSNRAVVDANQVEPIDGMGLANLDGAFGADCRRLDERL
jgi:hypothetical protein